MELTTYIIVRQVVSAAGWQNTAPLVTTQSESLEELMDFREWFYNNDLRTIRYAIMPTYVYEAGN